MNTRTETCSAWRLSCSSRHCRSPGAFAEHGNHAEGVMDVTRRIDVSGLDISSVFGRPEGLTHISS